MMSEIKPVTIDGEKRCSRECPKFSRPSRGYLCDITAKVVTPGDLCVPALLQENERLKDLLSTQNEDIKIASDEIAEMTKSEIPSQRELYFENAKLKAKISELKAENLKLQNENAGDYVAEMERLKEEKEELKTRMLAAEDEALKAYGLLEDAREWLDTWLLQDDCTCIDQCICGKAKLQAFTDSIRGFLDTEQAWRWSDE